MTIANGLSEHNDVRDNSVLLKAPEVGANPTVASLYFIGDANPASLSYRFIDQRQVVVWQDNLTTNTWQRLTDKIRLHLVYHTLNMLDVAGSCISIAVQPAIGIR